MNLSNTLKSALCTAVAATFVAASFSVNALPSIPERYRIKYSNWEQFRGDQADANGDFQLTGNLGNGTEDLRGILQVSQILDNDPLSPTFNQPVYNTGDGGEFLYGIFYGLDVITQSIGATGIDFEYGGGSLDLYVTTTSFNPFATGVAGFGATSNLYDGINTGVGAGSHYLSANLSAGLCGTNPLATLCSDSDLTPPFVNGDGTFFIDIGATANGVGSDNEVFDTNGSTGGTDGLATNVFRTISDANGNGVDDAGGVPCESGAGLTCTKFLGGWNLISEDPVIGIARVPEPSSLALLGIAVAGLGFASRRRQNKAA